MTSLHASWEQEFHSDSCPGLFLVGQFLQDVLLSQRGFHQDVHHGLQYAPDGSLLA